MEDGGLISHSIEQINIWWGEYSPMTLLKGTCPVKNHQLCQGKRSKGSDILYVHHSIIVFVLVLLLKFDVPLTQAAIMLSFHRMEFCLENGSVLIVEYYT